MKAVFSCLATLLCLTNANARLALPEIATGVHGQLFSSAIESESPRPAVVILHGREGMRPIYLEEAQLIAAHGYEVLVLDYYAAAGWGGFTRSERTRRWNLWEVEVARAVDFLRAQSRVDGNRIALVGMSQGATLALTIAPKLPKLRAVVDYYGPHPEGWYVANFMGHRTPKETSLLETMPPVLILHGSWDTVVPVENSRRLYEQLRARGKEAELRVYPFAMHSLNHSRSHWPIPVATRNDARTRVLSFLDQHLGGSVAIDRQFIRLVSPVTPPTPAHP